jgi:hypothetical protein
MLPSPRLFRSRWTALLWAAGIVWTAVDIADSAPAPKAANTSSAHLAPADAPADDPANAADIAALANLIGG